MALRSYTFWEWLLHFLQMHKKEDVTVDTEIKNAVSTADTEARYDDKAKRLLSKKFILARILIKTVDEFRGRNPKDVVLYIEGDPFVSVVPVEPG